MFERFTPAARAAVNYAKGETALRGDRRIGTDHLLIALLHDDPIATAVRTTTDAARHASAELDRHALAAVGLDLGDIEPEAEAALGRHTPFTAGAKRVLAHAVRTAAGEKTRTISTRHLALALLEQPQPDPAAALLDALGVDRKIAREHLAADWAPAVERRPWPREPTKLSRPRT